jgi:hypothetical protein
MILRIATRVAAGKLSHWRRGASIRSTTGGVMKIRATLLTMLSAACVGPLAIADQDTSQIAFASDWCRWNG